MDTSRSRLAFWRMKADKKCSSSITVVLYPKKMEHVIYRPTVQLLKLSTLLSRNIFHTIIRVRGRVRLSACLHVSYWNSWKERWRERRKEGTYRIPIDGQALTVQCERDDRASSPGEAGGIWWRRRNPTSEPPLR